MLVTISVTIELNNEDYDEDDGLTGKQQGVVDKLISAFEDIVHKSDVKLFDTDWEVE